MVEVLKAKGAPHVFHHYPTAGHMNITPEVIEKSLAFIRDVSATPYVVPPTPAAPAAPAK
jgi:hypothetical protein